MRGERPLKSPLLHRPLEKQHQCIGFDEDYIRPLANDGIEQLFVLARRPEHGAEDREMGLKGLGFRERFFNRLDGFVGMGKVGCIRRNGTPLTSDAGWLLICSTTPPGENRAYAL